MSSIPNASRLGLESLVVRDSVVIQGSTEFNGSVRFGPRSSVVSHGPILGEVIKVNSLQSNSGKGISIENLNAVKVSIPSETVPTGSVVDLSLGSVIWGPVNMFTEESEGSPGHINILKSGVYSVNIDIQWAPNAGDFVALYMKVNGDNVRFSINSPIVSGPFSVQSLSFNDILNAGDIVSFSAEHSNLSPVNINMSQETRVTCQYMHESPAVLPIP